MADINDVNNALATNDDIEADESIFSEITDIIKQTNLSQVSADSAGFENLPDGYYVTEVSAAKIKRSKSSNKPMISLTFTAIDDGYSVQMDEAGNVTSFGRIEGTNGRKAFKHYVFSDAASLKRFASDMMKFEDPNEIGKSLLPIDAWSDGKTMYDSIQILVSLQSKIWIYIHTEKGKDGKDSSWTDLVSFGRAEKLGLPVNE